MSSTTMRCPRCGVFLFLAPTDKAQLAGCGRCGGVFLGKASAQRVFESLDAEVHALASMASKGRSSPLEVPTHEAAGACPQCAAEMHTRRIEMASVVVDDCEAHGTWFDRDEMQRWMTSAAQLRGRTIGPSPAVAAGVAAGAAGVAGVAAYAASDTGGGVVDGNEGVAAADSFADNVVEGIGDAAEAVDAGSIVFGIFGAILGAFFDD